VNSLDDGAFRRLDTQGYDLEVIRGTSQSLPFIVAIQTELPVVPAYQCMPDYVTALAHLRDIGYTPTGFFSVVGHRTTGRSHRV
jgi:hypothetical protein